MLTKAIKGKRSGRATSAAHFRIGDVLESEKSGTFDERLTLLSSARSLLRPSYSALKVGTLKVGTFDPIK